MYVVYIINVDLFRCVCLWVRLRQDWESGSRELGLLKERHLDQAVKYSRALEEQRNATARERELLTEVVNINQYFTLQLHTVHVRLKVRVSMR